MNRSDDRAFVEVAKSMLNNRDLFSISSTTCCVEYENIRGERNERCAQIKKHCDDLWSAFQGYADSHFVSEFSHHFHERWFEMYLAVSLLRRDFAIKSYDEGPDILLDMGDHRIWIEAVCATGGELGLPDSVPKMTLGRMASVPVREYVLRIRTSLQEKARKFQKYIDNSVVCERDALAVAINIYGIDGIMPGVDHVMMRALYGLGDPVVRFDKYTRKVMDVAHDSVTEIVKKSGSSVGTIPFVDCSMPHISSALIFWSNAANLPTRLGDDCVLYPNLTCRIPWRERALPMGREWMFAESHKGWKGSPRDYLTD